MKLQYDVKYVPRTLIYINNKVRSTQHWPIEILQYPPIYLLTLGDRNHNGSSKSVNHYGAQKKKKLQNQNLGGNVRLVNISIHTKRSQRFGRT